MPDDFVKAAQISELSPGSMKKVDLGRDEILLTNVDGQIYACDNVCSHAYASLVEGDLNGAEVECPLHGSLFNVITGEALTPPAVANVRVFQVRIEGQDILVGPEKKA